MRKKEQKRNYESPSMQVHDVELEAVILVGSTRDASTSGDTPIKEDWGDDNPVNAGDLTF
jgi:hypothetical protein